jgi:hypothetical protein
VLTSQNPCAPGPVSCASLPGSFDTFHLSCWPRRHNLAATGVVISSVAFPRCRI